MTLKTSHLPGSEGERRQVKILSHPSVPFGCVLRFEPTCASAKTTCAIRLNVETLAARRDQSDPYMGLCSKLGIAAVILLLPAISAYPAGTRNRIDPDPVTSQMPAAAKRCAVVCGIGCIRPWAPRGTAFPVPYDGGLFDCLRSGSVTPHRSGIASKPLLQAVQSRAEGVVRWGGGSSNTAASHAVDVGVQVILEKHIVPSKFSRADSLGANSDSSNRFVVPR